MPYRSAGFKHRYAVIDKEREPGQRLLLLQGTPEANILFGYSDIMGTHNIVHKSIKAGDPQLQIQTLTVRIGDQHNSVSGFPKLLKKVLHMRSKGHQVFDLFFSCAISKPKVSVKNPGSTRFKVPSWARIKQVSKALFRLLCRQGVVAGIMLRYTSQPEIVVEV